MSPRVMLIFPALCIKRTKLSFFVGDYLVNIRNYVTLWFAINVLDIAEKLQKIYRVRHRAVGEQHLKHLASESTNRTGTQSVLHGRRE